MKLVSYAITTEIGESVRIGALTSDSVIDLNFAYSAYLLETGMSSRVRETAAALIPLDMVGFLEGGKTAMQTAGQVVDFVLEQTAKNRSVAGPGGEKIVRPIKDVRLLAPVPRPPSIRDSQSFEVHLKGVMEKSGRTVPEVWYENPTYYKGNPCSVIGTGAPVIWPAFTQKFDYELEFGIYIGKKGKNIKGEEATEYIAGYTIFNDFSARDILGKEMVLLGPAKGKDFDTGNVMGPCMVTPDELDISNLKMMARVNGEVWSESNTSSMYWSFPQIIEFASMDETLYPGDFIGSGTAGTGCGMELDRWIKPGDIIELEVEGIGVITNRVIKES